jgi:hypothetical protein
MHTNCMQETKMPTALFCSRTTKTNEIIHLGMCPAFVHKDIHNLCVKLAEVFHKSPEL